MLVLLWLFLRLAAGIVIWLAASLPQLLYEFFAEVLLYPVDFGCLLHWEYLGNLFDKIVVGLYLILLGLV